MDIEIPKWFVATLVGIYVLFVAPEALPDVLPFLGPDALPVVATV